TTGMAGGFFPPGHPILVSLLHLTIWVSPLILLSNVMSYLNGSAFLSTKSSGFAGKETWEELDFVTRFQLQASPAVMARGMLGMLRYDATAVLKDVNVPALVVAGDRDSVCKSEASERMRRDIPDAQLTRLVPAKHMGLIEHRCRLFIGSVATLQLPRGRLAGCSSWRLRFAVYSNGVNSSRRSSSWQWDGICASRFRTATSRSYWPSVGSRWITSPSGVGSSGTPRSWIGGCANGSRQQTTLGGWTRRTCGGKGNGCTCNGPWTPPVRRSTFFSRLKD